MTKKFENIDSSEIKVNALGEVELSAELENAVSGGFSPEEAEDAEGNTGCNNIACSEQIAASVGAE